MPTPQAFGVAQDHTHTQTQTRARARVEELVRTYALVMPDGSFFSHVTSAFLWDIPLPRGLWGIRGTDAAAHVDRLDVAVLSPARHPRAAGIPGHEVARRLVSVVRHPVLDVPLASPASTWAMLGAVLWDPYDLVAAGDAFVREPMFHDDPPALATTRQLQTAVAAGRRVGVGRLRAALPLVRTRSASRRETWVRLALIDAGLPEPELNVSVRSDDGRQLAVVDLAYPDLRVAIEYEGEHHLFDPRQWTRDIARHEELAAHGWVVIRVTKLDLLGGGSSLVARVRRAIAARAA